MSKKDNERDWWLFMLFMLIDHDPEFPETLDDHVCRLADAYANPRDFIAALKRGKPHPPFTGVMPGKANLEFIKRWERFIDQAPYSQLRHHYEDAVAEEERERIERLQEAQRIVKNEGRLEAAK
jgi:hypothetical protein